MIKREWIAFFHRRSCYSSSSEAANRSHAPYSNSFSGIALATQDKRIFQGSYAENAAFNPLPALQTALNYLLLSGNEVENIERAVLIEHPQMSLSYRAMAEDLLAYLVEKCDTRVY